MACMTLFAQPMAMATTQLVSAIQREENFSLARGAEDRTHVFAHELGRGHRRTRRAAAPHALGGSRGPLKHGL